ncbi:hypothetical protein FHU40_000946 [Nocardioides soli]|uniref:Uncharacterized protein n=1 Tax=Nocardioides soli TaxID=1036020 RepID=A0A7W4VT27_9ACTN|nr:hypothetical protein [Nocardioides soli]
MCQPSTAHDVIASAERRGIVVNVRGGPGDLAPDGARSQVSPVRNLTPASTSPQEGLW